MSRDYPGAEKFFPPRVSLASLRVASKSCRGCPLYKFATQTVFGAGPRGARLVIVGEQPGNDEDLAGMPFVGPAGRVLNDALVEAGIARSDTYVTNIVKHFKFEKQGKRRLHRTPGVREVAACAPWTIAELGVIKPSVMLLLGATAAQWALGKSFRVTAQRGKPLASAYAEQTVATVHPSSILRQRTSADRAAALAAFVDDLRVVKHLLDARGRSKRAAAPRSIAAAGKTRTARKTKRPQAK